MTASPSSPPQPERKRFNLVSLSRPYFGVLVLLIGVLVIGGVYSLTQMPSGIYPEVAFPRISIIATAKGLAIKSTELSVTRPMEEAVSIVLGAVRVRSKTVRGASELSVDFAPGTDMVQALNDVRARVAEVGSQLPPGTQVIIERQTPSVFPIISFVVTGGRNLSQLRDYAFYDLRPRISRIPDVSYVTVQGGDVREILVEADPLALVAAHLSISELATLIGQDQRLAAVGRIDARELQYQVMTDTYSPSPDELAERVILNKDGQPLRVGDVARVAVSHEDRLVAVRSGGEDAVVLTVFRRLGGNALSVSAELNRVLAEAAPRAPPGVTVHPVYDQAQLVTTALDNVRDAILVGGALAVLVLFAFLKSWRATLIAALAIPTTLTISFVFLHLSGDTLNLMSLGGLAIAIGLVIDDTVVVIENIARHLAEGRRGDAAVAQASREISGAVVGSTLTTVMVFVPLAFTAGVVGQFFLSLSLALAIAILVSMLVSVTVIPVLTARYLAGRPMPSPGRIYQFFEGKYEIMLRVVVHWPKLTLSASVLVIVPAVWIFTHVESGFMPDMDEGAFVLDYFMPVGTSLAETDRVMRRVEAVLLDTPDVAAYVRRTGAELGFFATEPFTGDVLVSLKPPGERRSMQDVIEAVRARLEVEVPQLEIEFVPLIQDQINDLAGVEAPVEVKLFGSDYAVLRRLATEVGAAVESTEGCVDVDPHVRQGNPDVVVHVDSVEAERVGLSTQTVEEQLNAAMYGQVAATLPEQERLTNIRVRYPDRVRFNLHRLGTLPLEVPGGGGYVPLDQLAQLDHARSLNELWRENQQPMIFVTAEIEGRDLGSVVSELRPKLARLAFPPGYRWELSGNYETQQKSFLSLLIVLVVAAVLVFLLLAFQFRSLALPLLVFLTQPLSLTAALAALWITGVPLNVSSLMGAIMLVGLDVKNGIILIEYIGQLRAAGMGLREALVQAGRVRFRPILMTSLTTILGLFPLALGLGPGAQMQQPLAVAVIGGLTANMLFTRLIIPPGYELIARFRERGTVAV